MTATPLSPCIGGPIQAGRTRWAEDILLTKRRKHREYMLRQSGKGEAYYSPKTATYQQARMRVLGLVNSKGEFTGSFLA